MREHFTLSQVNGLLAAAITRLPFSNCWVLAEILQVNQAASGHVYMDLVEKEGSKTLAKMQAVLWSGRYAFLRTKFRDKLPHFLKVGSKVLLEVKIDFHNVYGLKMTINDIDPSATVGEMELRRQETLAKLEKGKYFDRNNQIPLPDVIQRIAVVSSAQAAGYTDFIRHLQTNKYGYDIKSKLFAASMQGESAPESIRKSLAQIASHADQFDALAIIRGGGSKFDLDCFNDFQLAVDIAEMPLPVITGIGHERDDTIADLVSHTAVKTPTALADLVIDSLLHFEQHLVHAHQRVIESTRTLLHRHQQQLLQLASRYELGASNLLERKSQQLTTLKDRLMIASKTTLNTERQKLGYLSKIVGLLDIESTKRRGFSISRHKGELITDAASLKKGDVIETEVHKGTLHSTIKSIGNG